MSKKRKKAHPVQPVKPKGNVVWRQSAEEATLASKPRYNGFACGHGAHGSAKYSRARAKQAWKRQMRQEGASRGSFPFPVLALVAADRCRKNGAGLRRVWHRVPSRPIMSQLLIAGSMG
ncbi:hypothetical protein C1850_08240 [Adlercreutzia equolifaciens subsp. celatus]|uniref:Uncharacterized protein n=1 Tax=Adlercreutzia equolifaciens subsp. celatus TaxID=394340 RepID=A0A369NX46_9ACTN|nr:hypothetical protein [Adlercreutzia equolifaciens]RDC43303.1 hypothetical protein C1850_08240 [Adlercreutzia equolifaciens subsp. celatus]